MCVDVCDKRIIYVIHNNDYTMMYLGVFFLYRGVFTDQISLFFWWHLKVLSELVGVYPALYCRVENRLIYA